MKCTVNVCEVAMFLHLRGGACGGSVRSGNGFETTGHKKRAELYLWRRRGMELHPYYQIVKYLTSCARGGSGRGLVQVAE